MQASLEIIRTGFYKCCISNAFVGTEHDVVRGAENKTAEASNNGYCSGCSDKDAACGND